MATVLNVTSAPDNVRDICGIALEERHNLDEEMATMIKCIEKKWRRRDSNQRQTKLENTSTDRLIFNIRLSHLLAD